MSISPVAHDARGPRLRLISRRIASRGVALGARLEERPSRMSVTIAADVSKYVGRPAPFAPRPAARKKSGARIVATL